MSKVNIFKAVKLAVALHEAAHVVALRDFAGVGSRVKWEEPENAMGWAFTQSLGKVSNQDHLSSIMAALIITDDINKAMPTILLPHSDWEEVSRATGLNTEEIRATPAWKTVSAWLDTTRLEIGAVAQEIVDGRELFEIEIPKGE